MVVRCSVHKSSATDFKFQLLRSVNSKYRLYQPLRLPCPNSLADPDTTRMAPLVEDIERIIDRLPATKGECYRLRHLVIQKNVDEFVTDEALADILPLCPNLLSIVLSGVPKITTDKTIVKLASSAVNLQGIDLTGCSNVTDVGILELTAKSLPMEWIQLNGLVSITDPSVCAIAKSCPRLVELELCDLPLLTAVSVRDIWSFSRKLRTLRLSRCTLLTDKAFPSVSGIDSTNTTTELTFDKPLPPRPNTWLEELPSLILRHRAENLRVLDLGYCIKLTDEAVVGIISHAPKIQTLNLSGCVTLTDRSMESICELGGNLDILMMAHVSKITDQAIVKLARSCVKLRSIDFACKFFS